MKFKLDLTGQVFNRWTVLELDYARSAERAEAYYKCRCECGAVKSVYGYSLRTNENTSCGCRKGDLAKINRQRNNPLILKDIERFLQTTDEDHPQKSLDLAWAAGFFDGEGCTVYSDRLVVSVCQVELAPLQRFNAAIGTGSILGPYQSRGNRKPYHAWSVCSQKAISSLEKLWPYLSLPKRQQALEKVLEYRAYVKSTLKES